MCLIEVICQVGMLLFGGAAIFFVSKKNKWMRYGYIFGLIGQPFWIIVAIRTEQWGMLALVIFYTLNWIKGIYNYWIKQIKMDKSCETCKHEISSICLECDLKTRQGWEPQDNYDAMVQSTIERINNLEFEEKLYKDISGDLHMCQD